MTKSNRFAEEYTGLDIGLLALTLTRNIMAYLHVLKLLIEGLAGNFTNWPADEAKAADLLKDFFGLINEQRILTRKTLGKVNEYHLSKVAAGKSAEIELNSDPPNSNSLPIFRTPEGSSQEPQTDIKSLEGYWIELATWFKYQLPKLSSSICEQSKLIGSLHSLPRYLILNKKHENS